MPLAGRGQGKCPSVSLQRGKVIIGEGPGRSEVMMTVVMEAKAVGGEGGNQDQDERV